MYYFLVVNTEPNTLYNNPKIEYIDVTEGLLEFVDVSIPDWVSRLAKFRILYNSFQILPFNPNSWFTGDNLNIRIPLNLQLDQEPFRLEIQQVNEDDTYNHAIAYGFSVALKQPANSQDLLRLSGLLQVEG